MTALHPLADLVARAARGMPPPLDGDIDVFPSPPGPVDAVLAFTGHHVVAADVDPAWVRARLPVGDFLAPMSPRFLDELSGLTGAQPGSLDVVLAAQGRRGEPGLELTPLDAGTAHPRVERAERYRTDVRAFATRGEEGVLVLGRGLAGRWEAAFEVDEQHRGRGLGRALVAAARSLVADDELVFMQTAPGNVASLHAILAGGFEPIGGEVLFLRRD
jgi:GNAT superfamily N-acetyltransferase